MSLRSRPFIAALVPAAFAPAILALAALLSGAPAMAQQPQPATLRGTVTAVDGTMLTLKTRAGTSAQVKVSDKAVITGLARITLADIAPNSFVGVAAVPQDGAKEGDPERAVSIHVFPEEARGSGEGTRPYDLQPKSTMTNGAVSQQVVSTDGKTLTIKYRGGDKQILVTPETSLVRFEPGTAAELKPGAQVVVRTTPAADGTREATRILVGRGDVVPAL